MLTKIGQDLQFLDVSWVLNDAQCPNSLSGFVGSAFLRHTHTYTHILSDAYLPENHCGTLNLCVCVCVCPSHFLPSTNPNLFGHPVCCHGGNRVSSQFHVFSSGALILLLTHQTPTFRWISGIPPDCQDFYVNLRDACEEEFVSWFMCHLAAVFTRLTTHREYRMCKRNVNLIPRFQPEISLLHCWNQLTSQSLWRKVSMRLSIIACEWG